MNKEQLLAYHKTLTYKIHYRVYGQTGILLTSMSATGNFDLAEKMEAEYFSIMKAKKGCTKRSWYQRDPVDLK